MGTHDGFSPETPALVPTREAAWALVCEFVQSDSLRKHMRCVEQAMRAYAARFGEDVEYWGIVGLIHDFDYEQYPTLDQHVWVGSRILAERGWPAELIRTIQSHADYMGVPREKLIDHALFACDELSGFITAVTYVRPSKSLADVDARAVIKKLKDKAFRPRGEPGRHPPGGGGAGSAVGRAYQLRDRRVTGDRARVRAGGHGGRYLTRGDPAIARVVEVEYRPRLCGRGRRSEGDMAATRILVVDDDALIRVNMVEMLTRMGYEVVGEADTAATAVQKARELKPDLVIMDIRMPGDNDGIDAAATLTGENIAPTLLVSAYSQPDYVARANEAGVVGYLVKPVTARPAAPGHRGGAGPLPRVPEPGGETQRPARAIGDAQAGGAGQRAC